MINIGDIDKDKKNNFEDINHLINNQGFRGLPSNNSSGNSPRNSDQDQDNRNSLQTSFKSMTDFSSVESGGGQTRKHRVSLLSPMNSRDNENEQLTEAQELSIHEGMQRMHELDASNNMVKNSSRQADGVPQQPEVDDQIVNYTIEQFMYSNEGTIAQAEE